MGAHSFSSYAEFEPYYFAMHSKRATRRLHLVGSLAGLAVTALGIRRRDPVLLAGLPALGYGWAWPAHFLVEGNNPASFGHPLWSLRGDWRMIARMLAGRDAEVDRTARAWLAAHGGDQQAAQEQVQPVPVPA